LEDLRGLNERRELERAKQALEAEVLQKDFLLKEVNHRIKNCLQIVSSILHLQCGHTENEEAIKTLQNASARVRAIAAVHERLYTGSDIREMKVRYCIRARSFVAIVGMDALPS
jgi:two-component sensor histidine kinase